MVILETQANLVDMSLPAPQSAVTGLVARRCAAKMRLSEKSAMSLYGTVKQEFSLAVSIRHRRSRTVSPVGCQGHMPKQFGCLSSPVGLRSPLSQ